MKKNQIRTILSFGEKIIAYLALTIVIILEVIKLLNSSLININSTDLSLCLIASSLLVVFQHVEDIKKIFNKSYNAVTSERFNDGLLDIFKKHTHIKSLDIMAHTTRTYVHSIADNDISVDNVRILVCKPKSSSSRQYPDQKAIASLDLSRDQAVESWKDLVKIGKVKHLEIRYYQFDPTFHFAIINNKHLHYGLYKMEHLYPGYHLYTLYTLDGSESNFAHHQLADFQGFFIHVFNNFSYKE